MPQLYAVAVYGFTEPSATPISMAASAISVNVFMGGSVISPSFAADMVAWNALSQRLFIWDYVVDFRAYAMPWPNYETLVPNARFLASHGELS